MSGLRLFPTGTLALADHQQPVASAATLADWLDQLRLDQPFQIALDHALGAVRQQFAEVTDRFADADVP